MFPLTFTDSTDRLDVHSFPTRRSSVLEEGRVLALLRPDEPLHIEALITRAELSPARAAAARVISASMWSRSEEHTSELQSPYDLVCRALLEKENGVGLCVTAYHKDVVR